MVIVLNVTAAAQLTLQPPKCVPLHNLSKEVVSLCWIVRAQNWFFLNSYNSTHAENILGQVHDNRTWISGLKEKGMQFETVHPVTTRDIQPSKIRIITSITSLRQFACFHVHVQDFCAYTELLIGTLSRNICLTVSNLMLGHPCSWLIDAHHTVNVWLLMPHAKTLLIPRTTL